MFVSVAAQNNAHTSGQGITRWSLTTTVILILMPMISTSLGTCIKGLTLLMSVLRPSRLSTKTSLHQERINFRQVTRNCNMSNCNLIQTACEVKLKVEPAHSLFGRNG